MTKRILVTGAAGFIGSHTTAALLARGDHVIGLDNLNDYYPASRKRSNVAELVRAGGERFAFVEGDVRDRKLLHDLGGKGLDAIVHLAAMAGVRHSVDDPWSYYDVNVNGTLNVLDCARACGKPNVVFASTSSVYGNTATLPFVESDCADRPLAPYAASKRAAELLGHSYHYLHGIDFTVLRFFTVYGPRGRPDLMPFKVLDSMRLGEAIPLYNGGQGLRDWTFVSDTVAGVVAAADRRLGYEIINIGRGQPIALSEFISLLEEVTGGRGNLVPAEAPKADMHATFADISKARSLLDYEPNVELRQGVRQLYEWYSARIGPIQKRSAN